MKDIQSEKNQLFSTKQKLCYTYFSQFFPPGGVGDDGEHELTHVVSVSPVVVGHTAVVTPHRAEPSGNEKANQ